VAEITAPGAGAPQVLPGRWRRFVESDLLWSFRRSPVTVAAAAVALIVIGAALLAPLIAPHDPYDLASLSLLDATDPPAWMADGNWSYPLGTDNQGRDILSAILYGTRLSLGVGVSAVLLSLVLGVALGLVAGWRGGWIDTVIMRVADVQLSFPAILIALLIDGVARSLLPRDQQAEITLYVLITAIALSYWVHFARTVRGSTMVERNKEYIQAARVIGVHPARIVVGHLLPNVIGPVLVIATINLATAVLTEATLSFLGVGLPPTEPSLGTLIRVGNDYLLSGDWWISIFPGIVLALLILSVNLLGDWLRDAFNPKLR
jgi:peptide/nickel transport system permease protein